jgi:hypothetical protein
MTDSQEKKAKDSQDSRTINIEIPIKSFEGMFRMMTGRSDFDTAGSSCCQMTQDRCCSTSEDERKQEFTFVLKRK